MRMMRAILGVVLASAALPAQGARLDPEERIAQRLAGREAGKPVDCIPQFRINSTEIFERTAILYKAGRTWYLNRPVAGKESLGRDDVLLTDTHSSDLCSIDVVRLLDSSSHWPRGWLGLGKFVPYSKPNR